MTAPFDNPLDREKAKDSIKRGLQELVNDSSTLAKSLDSLNDPDLDKDLVRDLKEFANRVGRKCDKIGNEIIEFFPQKAHHSIVAQVLEANLRVVHKQYYKVPGCDPEEILLEQTTVCVDGEDTEHSVELKFVGEESCKSQQNAHIRGFKGNLCFVEPGFENRRELEYQDDGIICPSLYNKIPVSQWKDEWLKWRVVIRRPDGLFLDSKGLPLPYIISATYYLGYFKRDALIKYLKAHPWVTETELQKIRGYEYIHVKIYPGRADFARVVEMSGYDKWRWEAALTGIGFRDTEMDFLGISHHRLPRTAPPG